MIILPTISFVWARDNSDGTMNPMCSCCRRVKRVPGKGLRDMLSGYMTVMSVEDCRNLIHYYYPGFSRGMRIHHDLWDREHRAGEKLLFATSTPGVSSLKHIKEKKSKGVQRSNWHTTGNMGLPAPWLGIRNAGSRWSGYRPY